MRWIDAGSRGRREAALLSAIVLFGAIATSLASWMEDKQLSVFGPKSSFSAPIVHRDGQDYVVLADVLQKLGQLEIFPAGDRLKLRFNSLDTELLNGESSIEIEGTPVKMPGKVLIENQQALVPLDGLQKLLQYFVNTGVVYRAESRRLFLGDSGVRFGLELSKGESTQLVLSFNTPVSPTISTEPGKLKIVFVKDALLMATQRWQFDDDVITSAEYFDKAEPELIITSTQPLLATFSNRGRVMTIAPPPEVAESTNPTPQESSADVQATAGESLPTPSTRSSSAAVATAPTQERYLVIIDASHGGRERGAALSAKLAEKDVTLTLARSLREQLTHRGVSSLLVRDSDRALTPDERAVIANTSQAALYLAIHAGGLDRGVRVYTSMLSASDASPDAVVPWEKAQAGFVNRSRVVGSTILEELGKNHVRVPSAPLPAPVRPLNNVAVPAVAIEVGPLNGDMESVSNQDYQEVVAKSLVSAVVAMRPRLERGK